MRGFLHKPNVLTAGLFHVMNDLIVPTMIFASFIITALDLVANRNFFSCNDFIYIRLLLLDTTTIAGFTSLMNNLSYSKH